MDEFLDDTTALYKNNQWQEILELNENSNNAFANKLLWVWPSKYNLKFINEVTSRFKIKGITSVGCGCGLLEWIITQSLGIKVIGLEVNREWWDSKYSPAPFIPLEFPTFPLRVGDLRRDFALLFCYFNDGEAFRNYLEVYTGDLVFIIGPGKSNGKYTDPLPFNPKFGSNKWKMHASQEVKNTGDYIVAYCRDT